MKISKESFGRFEGKTVDQFTLQNDHGVTVKIATYGGTVTSIVTPDKEGQLCDISCGFDTLDGYMTDAYKANSPYFGCLVGRYAGRIKDGAFRIEGADYQLATNDGPNHLHGGIRGFDKQVWDIVRTWQLADAVAVVLSLDSPDGDESYPGTVKVKVEYQLTNDNELRINYQAETSQATPLSLTNHTYFNLNGFRDTVLDHVVQLDSDRYLIPDDTNVPVGGEAKVHETAADFTKPKRIGEAFAELPMGFEHYYCFDNPAGELRQVAIISEPNSGRTLKVLTTEPGGLFYTGRYTSDELRREEGTRFGPFRGFCVETSKYPNGPNIDGAPRSLLQPGEPYNETTVYRFDAPQSTPPPKHVL
ncbi:aldose epimerase family protein [Novipirellula artificiosorum]|uniref:Aldose 1-epimerase n=1 Tax=Novipirellula artificiosorum TaxID=2528016 RepID=A0A5C6DUH4_9BACT|nr:aldose epimerase family protein [Novipirellula artificiosorum]TWU38419.1 Aldose 1-epimerase precursor [Novipirellula artificiosorum]